jgi:hypothetical protein
MKRSGGCITPARGVWTGPWTTTGTAGLGMTFQVGGPGRLGAIGNARSIKPLKATTIINDPIERIGQYLRRHLTRSIGSKSESGFIDVTSLASSSE